MSHEDERMNAAILETVSGDVNHDDAVQGQET